MRHGMLKSRKVYISELANLSYQFNSHQNHEDYVQGQLDEGYIYRRSLMFIEITYE